MDDFTIIYQDAVRMKKAIEQLARDTKSDQVKREVKSLAAMLRRSKSVPELELTCKEQRELLKFLLRLKEETEHEPIPDLTQGFWGTSVRHSPQVGDRGRDVDSLDLGAQSLPNPVVDANGPDPDGTSRGFGEDNQGVARPLPKRKRNRPKRKSDIQYRSTIKRIDSEDT